MQQQKQGPKMPAVYISKYNRFVDNVIGRMNRILGKSYDPVRVKLLSNERKTVNRNNVNKKTNNKHKRNHPKKNEIVKNKMGELEVARTRYEIGEARAHAEKSAREPEFILISSTGAQSAEKSDDKSLKVRARPVRPSGNKKKNGNKRNSNKNSVNKKKVHTKQGNNTAKNKQKARATLFGLSSLRRDGDVSVNMMSDHTTVRTNFVLGPLTLRVEREIGTGARRELKSATATTEEMVGRLNLRITQGGAATLHSIKVLQPKQVRIESSDHDKTTEFMWRRSPQIAGIVSENLAAATRSMLQPPPPTRP